MRPAPTFLLVCAVLACVVLAAMVTAPQAQARNPFVKGQGEEAANATASPQGPAMPAVLAPYLSPILREIATAQQALKNRLASFGQAMRASPHGGAFWLFLGAAFLYGVVHAAGPGHGKAFACAYFASRPAGLRDAGLFSAIAMATHVFTAAGLVLGGAFVMRMSGVLAVERYGDWLITASYGLLALVGLAFSFDAVRELRRHWNPALECPANEGAGRRGLVATATAVGLAPCPGAAIVLVYALTQGLLLQGMAAMVAIAVGMSVTTTL
ncbi:MAG: nickel/cobalt transporter, partial [Oceanidesulfovibrio sp.]